MDLARPGDNCAPVVVSAVNAAIAYADAISASKLGVVNQRDHQAAPRLLREALGNALPDQQERRLRTLIAIKDEAQYGATSLRFERAKNYLQFLDDFALWAEDVLPRA